MTENSSKTVKNTLSTQIPTQIHVLQLWDLYNWAIEASGNVANKILGSFAKYPMYFVFLPLGVYVHVYDNAYNNIPS